MYTHTSTDRGDRNEKSCGAFGVGFLYRIVIPSVMNGLVKSITFSRSWVIDIPPRPISAFYKQNKKSNNVIYVPIVMLKMESLMG